MTLKKTITATISSALVGAVVLAGCSQPVLEVEAPQSDVQSGAQSGPADEEVVLSQEQVDRIVADVQAVLDEAEKAKDAALLTSRVKEPALDLRSSQFERAEKTSTDIPPLVINPELFSATAGTSWPRVLLVASNASGDQPAEVFFMTQQAAKEDYQLENWTRLVGGTSVKGVGIRDGSTVLEADAAGLVMTPKEVLTTYVNHLNSPDNEEYALFEDKVFAPRYRQELEEVNEAVAVAGNVKATASEKDFPIIGVSLETGEALISTAFTYDTVYTRTVPGSTFEMAGTPADYLEDKNVIGSVTVTYLVTMFFLVPPADSDAEVAVVGSERVITGVSRDDTEPTEEED